MPSDPICPRCGAIRPPDSPEGLCPECLLRLAWVSDISAGPIGDVANGGASRTTSIMRGRADGRGSLELLTETAGPLPRVLLRDTDVITGSGPVVSPGSPEMPDPVDRAGRLQLLGEVARGGMGAILKGRDNDLGRDLAVKVLLERHGNNPELLRRFVEEAQIAGQLQHPGVVPVYELGAFTDRRPYIAMKLVKGRTLADILAERPGAVSDLPRFEAIFLDVAQTMAYAHARGVIHRDLKPSNVMVGSFGEVQVMDWGLAKVLSRGGAADDAIAGKLEAHETVIATVRSGMDSDLSAAGSVMGTPSYMAPEQARGEEVDERVDVFALGSILCEILTGQPAFTGRTSGEIQRKAATGDLADAFSRLDACGADADLVAMAKDCLAREPADRPRDAGAIAGRVTAYLAGVQEKLRRAELERVEERARRRLTTVAASAMLLLGLMGGGGYAWIERQRAERVEKTAGAVDEALADAARLRGEAQAAATGEMARWDEALSAAKRAEGLLAQGEADAPLKGRVSTLLAQLDHERSAAAEKHRLAESDRLLLARLEAIRPGRIDDRDRKGLDDKVKAAFGESGYDLERMDPAAAAAALGGRAASVEIAAAIDEWVDDRRAGRPGQDTWKHLLAVAQAVDPDPFRNRIRSTVLSLDRRELHRLVDEAIARPDLPAATFVRLARSFGSGNSAAVDLLRTARRFHPDDYAVNNTLAGDCFLLYNIRIEYQQDALRYATATVALRPQSPGAHNNLGCVLFKIGNLERADGAIAEFREAVRLNPSSALAYSNLGIAYDEVGGRRPEAVAAWKEAVKLDASMGYTWYNLGKGLALLGDFEPSVDALRQARRLVQSGGSQAVTDPANDLARSERYVVMKKRLPGVLRGDDKPNPAERMDFARMCFSMGLFATSARFVKQAHAEAPELQENVPVGRRYYVGVFSAARAGFGDGTDEPPPSEAERAQFREQARLWFRDELESWKRRFAAGPTSASMQVRDTLEVARKKDYSLRGFTDPTRLAKLPEAEQAAWRAILAEVDALLIEWQNVGRDMEAAVMAELERRLPAMLRNQDRPADQADRRRVAFLCRRRELYAASVRFYEELLKNDAVLSDRPANPDRYLAACTAAMAGCGRGKDDPPPGEDEKARLRRLAHDWLEDELAARRRSLETGLAEKRPLFIRELRSWQDNTAFTGVRTAEALAKFPADEQRSWQSLWEEVVTLLKAAEAVGP